MHNTRRIHNTKRYSRAVEIREEALSAHKENIHNRNARIKKHAKFQQQPHKTRIALQNPSPPPLPEFHHPPCSMETELAEPLLRQRPVELYTRLIGEPIILRQNIVDQLQQDENISRPSSDMSSPSVTPSYADIVKLKFTMSSEYDDNTLVDNTKDDEPTLTTRPLYSEILKATKMPCDTTISQGIT